MTWFYWMRLQNDWCASIAWFTGLKSTLETETSAASESLELPDSESCVANFARNLKEMPDGA
jgi:hypothetical protein